ncbi:molybdopterin-dependent oxidoreductase [Fundidesulfovibrio terrae]|uniref:molybdopterin-dependent oxidoreductase n=1 Tax=Fundidesulfovibrio terrae TaxID=2922866 RepID=UPI002434D099|nr:molybdopterin-dependent oxidoreductase [Fundidesulfovibrio terrae]
MGFKRREFLGLAAGVAVGAAAGPAAWEAARDLSRMSQDMPGLPGLSRSVVRQTTTVSLACPSGMGVSVLTVDGKPMLVRGNPGHPLSQGAITPPAQAEAYRLHDPSRIRGPLLKNASGEFEPVSWAQALDTLAERISQAQGSVLAVGPAREGTLTDLLAVFMERFGPDGHFTMPSEAAAARAAVALMGGSGQPGYDLDNAPGLVLLGADAFESMPASPRFRKAWSGREGAYSAFFGPVRGASASLCRQWHPLPAGQEAALAMGLAWHLADLGRITGKAPDLVDFIALARARFGPEEIRRLTGLAPETMRRAASEVASGALPVPGSPCGEGLGLAPMVAGLALSVMTGRVNRPGGIYLNKSGGEGWSPALEVTVPHDAPTVASQKAAPAKASPSEAVAAGSGSAWDHPGPWLSRLTPAMIRSLDLSGRFKDVALGLRSAPDVLLLVESDPAACLPEAQLAARAVGQARFKAAFTARMNASARLCDLILPAPMPLERWDDVSTPYGLAFACYGLARPIARSLADARHPGDVLLDIAERLGRPLGISSFRQALRERSARLEAGKGYVARSVPPWKVLAGEPRPAPEADLWRGLLDGQLWVAAGHEKAELACGAKFLAEVLAPEAVDLGAPLVLAPQASQRTTGGGDGVLVQSLTALAPRWITGILDSLPPGHGGAPAGASGNAVRPGVSVARINAATALKARVKPGDRVKLAGAFGHLEAVVALDESVMDGHAAMLLGLGEGIGGNVRSALSTLPEPGTGLQAWAGCRVTVERL